MKPEDGELKDAELQRTIWMRATLRKKDVARASDLRKVHRLIDIENVADNASSSSLQRRPRRAPASASY
jgi:hypothetical protein